MRHLCTVRSTDRVPGSRAPQVFATASVVVSRFRRGAVGSARTYVPKWSGSVVVLTLLLYSLVLSDPRCSSRKASYISASPCFLRFWVVVLTCWTAVRPSDRDLAATASASDRAAALLFFFIIGAVCPLIIWLLTKRYPNSWLNYVK